MTTREFIFAELRQDLRKLVTPKFRSLFWQTPEAIPTTVNLAPGAKTVTANVATGYGVSQLMSSGASDIPVVKVGVTQDELPIVMAVISYDETFAERRSLNYAGKRAQINLQKLQFAERAIAEKMNIFALFGDSGIGCTGLGNFPQITVNNPSFNVNTAVSTVADFNTVVDFLLDEILGLGLYEFDNTSVFNVCMSRNFMTRLVKARHPQDAMVSAMTVVRDRLREAGVLNGVDGVDGGIRFIARSELGGTVLQANGVRADATKDRILTYAQNDMVVSRQVESVRPKMFDSDFIFTQGTTIFYPMFLASAATFLHDTTYVRYTDVTAAT